MIIKYQVCFKLIKLILTSMKLIKPSFEIIESQGYLKDIEVAGRTCYKSEDKITSDSAKEFVNRMINSKHFAMLEHGTIYLYLYPGCPITGYKYRDNKYSKYVEIRESEKSSPQIHKFITTNYRVLVESGWIDDLQYQCESTEYHEKRTSVRFICDRGVTHEFVRHRVFSFAQESTRYCNYSKDKFHNELTFILPCWSKIEPIRIEDRIELRKFIWGTSDTINEITFDQSWLHILLDSEITYCGLISRGYTPQQARAVLPNSLKSELIMTGFDSDWEGFFKLRDDSHAHPQAFELSHPLHEEFIKLNKCK